MIRDESRTAATSKMELRPLTIITKCSILDVPAVLDLPLMINIIKSDLTLHFAVSSRTQEAVVWRCFVEKGVLRNFAKLTGKYLCQNLFFNKVAGFRLATLLKKRLWHTDTQVFVFLTIP